MLEAPVHKPRKHGLDKKVAQLCLVVEAARPQLAPLDARPLGHEAGDIDAALGNGPGQPPQLHDAAVEGEHVEVGLEVRAAEEVNDKVDALAAVQGLDLTHPRALVRVLVHVDGGGGAELADSEVALVLLAGGGKDLRGSGGRDAVEVGVRGELDARDRDG